MPSSTRTKSPRGPQHQSKDSGSSTLTFLSSSTATSSDSEWSFSEPQTPKKPWAIKALKALGYKVKGSKKEKNDSDGIRKKNIRIVAKESLNYYQDIIDISEETIAATRQAFLEKQEELDLLPDFPEPTEYKFPSQNDRHVHRSNHRRPQISPEAKTTCRRSGSTPNLKEAATAKRLSEDDPFYLEELLKKFPAPPTTLNVPRIIISPPSEPSSPRLRCSSDASIANHNMRSTRKIRGHAKPLSPNLLHRPIHKDSLTRPGARLASKASLPILQSS